MRKQFSLFAKAMLAVLALAGVSKVSRGDSCSVPSYLSTVDWGEYWEWYCDDWWGEEWTDESGWVPYLICEDCIDCRWLPVGWWAEAMVEVPNTVSGEHYEITLIWSDGNSETWLETGNGGSVQALFTYDSSTPYPYAVEAHYVCSGPDPNIDPPPPAIWDGNTATIQFPPDSDTPFWTFLSANIGWGEARATIDPLNVVFQGPDIFGFDWENPAGFVTGTGMPHFDNWESIYDVEDAIEAPAREGRTAEEHVAKHRPGRQIVKIRIGDVNIPAAELAIMQGIIEALRLKEIQYKKRVEEELRRQGMYSYVVYTKLNNRDGRVYVGYAEGPGSPWRVTSGRDLAHQQGGPGNYPVSHGWNMSKITCMITYADGPSWCGRAAIRGMEHAIHQYYRDSPHGAGNVNNPIGPENKSGASYWMTAMTVFTPIYLVSRGWPADLLSLDKFTTSYPYGKPVPETGARTVYLFPPNDP